jgi:hypothetical protein
MSIAREAHSLQFILVPPTKGNFVTWARKLGDDVYKSEFNYVLDKQVDKGYVLLTLNSLDNAYTLRINEFGNRATVTCVDIGREGYRDLQLQRIREGLERVFQKVEVSQSDSANAS